MKFQLDFDFPALEKKIAQPATIFLIGSCFAESITKYLQTIKHQILSNPHGILYNTQSIYRSLLRIVNRQEYTSADLFERDGLHHSFDFHSSFSGTNQAVVLDKMNRSINEAYHFLRTTDYVIITLGTSFVYKHLAQQKYVGNNHKMPAAHFSKQLLSVADNAQCLSELTKAIKSINPTVQFIFTVSPVRHIRDGLIENNVSKANLISAVHSLKEEGYYFPAYELVTDVLRDYRFFKKDMVHPSEQAIDYVWKVFSYKCLSIKDAELRQKILQLNNNLSHRPLHAEGESYKTFLKTMRQQLEQLKNEYPNLDFAQEIEQLS